MATSTHHKHTAVYLAALGGLISYATFTIITYEIFPPPMQGRQLWFTDMMDSSNVKAYEREMVGLPEGVISRSRYIPNHDRATAEGKALTHAYAVDEDFLVSGEWNFATYCAPCHDADGSGMGPVTNGSLGARFNPPGAPLAGDYAVTKNYTDGYLYLTIRNGSAIMPAYDWAMSDTEMWATVEYIRTLEGAQYVPPETAEAEGEASSSGEG